MGRKAPIPSPSKRTPGDGRRGITERPRPSIVKPPPPPPPPRK